MKIAVYSDLHLEFDHGWRLPDELDADVLVLAGDIFVLPEYHRLKSFLSDWYKPVLFVTGNHEYYGGTPIPEANKGFSDWLNDEMSNVTFLKDEGVTIDGVHFFGGTMWTNFNHSDPLALEYARSGMNDFYKIHNADGTRFLPTDSVTLHEIFKVNLENWFQQNPEGKHVVISHHAPINHPNTKYKASKLTPAFNSLDMVGVIETHQPDLWIYGHTHECDDQVLGKTGIVSNQLGYPLSNDSFECDGFNPLGMSIKV